MLASEIVDKLKQLIEKYGDKAVYHEDNECNAYLLSKIVYDEKEEEFKIS